MGFLVELQDPVSKDCLEMDTPHFMAGGDVPIEGTPLMHLKVTYNYADRFYKALDPNDGLRALNDMSAAQSIPLLETAITNLGDDTDPDYWKSTDGNAKRVLAQLLTMAKMRPDGVWFIG